MSFVRTLSGDLDPARLGVVNAHDHLIRVGAGEVYIEPDHLLADVGKAAEEAQRFVDASKRWAASGTIVDMCPAACGRSVSKLQQVNDLVPDLHIVAASGFHQQKVYLEPNTTWVNQYSVTQIADLLIADVCDGIDEHDYMGPLVQRSSIRAGVLKWSSGYGRISDWEQKAGVAVVIAARETGCPISTHTTAGSAALEQAQFLLELGAAPQKIAIGHVQRNADVWYLEQILALGCYLELDGTNRIKYQPDDRRVRLVRSFIADGYGNQILLGTDSGKASYQKAYGSVTGIDFDPSTFAPRLLSEGVDPSDVENLLINNGAEFFSFGDGAQQ